MTAERVESILGTHARSSSNLRLTYNNDPKRTDEYLKTAEVLMVAGPVDLVNLARRAPSLRWVQLSSAGAEAAVDHIPQGVSLTNVRGVHKDRAGEFGITSLLMLNNLIPAFASQQRNHVWRQAPVSPITGKSVCILGLGALGGACAKWAKTFGMNVIGVTRSRSPHEFADEVVGLEDIEKVFKRSDFVVIALPLTPETKGCIGQQQLDCLPVGAALVNIGRAAVLDYDALVAKLKDGTLSCAILDVFLEEPLPQASALWDVPNLLITPHCGLDDQSDYGLRCLHVFADNLKAYLAGEVLKTVVDPSKGY